MRLETLMLAKNQISRIDSEFAKTCPQLQSLVLSFNQVATFETLDNLAEGLSECNQFSHLVLVGNLVTHLPHYRLYAIAVMPETLRVLDFAKVTDNERK